MGYSPTLSRNLWDSSGNLSFAQQNDRSGIFDKANIDPLTWVPKTNSMAMDAAIFIPGINNDLYNGIAPDCGAIEK